MVGSSPLVLPSGGSERCPLDGLTLGLWLVQEQGLSQRLRVPQSRGFPATEQEQGKSRGILDVRQPLLTGADTGASSSFLWAALTQPRGSSPSQSPSATAREGQETETIQGTHPNLTQTAPKSIQTAPRPIQHHPNPTQIAPKSIQTPPNPLWIPNPGSCLPVGIPVEQGMGSGPPGANRGSSRGSFASSCFLTN